jgi:hypothetical protein
MFRNVVQSLLCDTVQAGRYVYRQRLRHSLRVKQYFDALSGGEVFTQSLRAAVNPTSSRIEGCNWREI